MATILKGAPVVAAMNERNAALCEQLKAKGITPTLAVVRVGEREDDLSYERGVMTRCGKVGVAVRQFVLSADATQEQLLRVLDEVNTDDGIHGCLLFRPLPKQFDDRTIRAALRANGYEQFFSSPTNQTFCLMSTEQIARLRERVDFAVWEVYDETHSIIRFATSWATKEEDVRTLCAILRECAQRAKAAS